MNTISGRLILKESGVGIPNLLLVLSSPIPHVVAPSIPSAPAPDSAPPPINRLGSVLTGRDGAFVLTFDDASFQNTTTKIGRPDLHATVLAPEEPGVASDALVLYSSVVPRQNAGEMEQYIVRLTTAQLQKAQIPIPSEVSEDFERLTW